MLRSLFGKQTLQRTSAAARYIATSGKQTSAAAATYITPSPQFPQPLAKPEEKRPNIMKVIERESVARADHDGRADLFRRRVAPKDRLCAGDVVFVETQNSMTDASQTSNFTGVCIGIYRRGIDTSFILRNVINKVGVEMRFMAYSPMVKRIEILQKGEGFRRAKLFYLRENPGKTFQLKALKKMAQSAAAAKKH
ncbi:hypothetical protein FBU59_002740 [Linderina macrospora]|uniref:Uncharacterized protein n=1 Tax=Linderina macrospora TaxID=4868 RepID=A0ACC1JAK4_9FUNG|nr:hypothetical protein FBU59_002740 [Linderina macrospora]